MEIKALPIEELRKLLAAVSEHGKQHLVEVEADLLQTTFLLNEAIEKLGAGFAAIHEAVAQQQLIIAQLTDSQALPQASVEKLDILKHTISDEVNAVVTSLQFQDLTSQLISRTIKRVIGLKDLLHELETHGNAMDPSHEHEQIAQFLEMMSHNLHEGSHALSGGLRRSVGQQDMATGDIDLF
ncbi:MAG: chemotaxis protein [Betaproteobacteria bacterium HGW-Betaproteobacteria-22]|nr:MAG: chemotaxis protein [Betaproteobacteria bacterium HGW-Betaproteobacteria-22]